MSSPSPSIAVARALAVGVGIVIATSSVVANAESPPPVLRLGVSLTPAELRTFEGAVAAVDASSDLFDIALEQTPQSGQTEHLNAQLAAGDLPDVLRIPGLSVQGPIRRGAFMDLTTLGQAMGLEDFYPGPLEQFGWNGRLWGIPDTAAPDVLFTNTAMFEAAGIELPDDSWTTDDLRSAALRLTLDAAGRTADDPAFDPSTIVQWGWNAGLTMFWHRHLLQSRGWDVCASPDCTQMDWTSPGAIDAADWWISLARDLHVAPADPYGGSDTGVPGDPFLVGLAAMGYDGYFAVGQLAEMGAFDYDISQPVLGVDGQRHTALSTNGYVVSAHSEHPEAAQALVVALTDAGFLAATWGQPGHFVPARMSVADSVIDPSRAPLHQAPIVQAMAYGSVFLPSTSAAFEAFSATSDLFTKANRGILATDDAMAQVQAATDRALARDREP